jgi:pyruvate formate-lyase activating enzyme-like uncharacterized protein
MAFYEEKDPLLVQIENDHKSFVEFIDDFQAKYCNLNHVDLVNEILSSYNHDVSSLEDEGKDPLLVQMKK